MKLDEAKAAAVFAHGFGELRVLQDSAQCPQCLRAVKLAVVWPDKSAACLACTGPSKKEAVRP